MFRALVWSLVGLGFFAMTPSASAALIQISDTQPLLANGPCGDQSRLPAEYDFAIFDYSGQPSLPNLKGLSFSITMEDGDTGVGEEDFNNLSLLLDGIDVGIKLNGFTDQDEVTQTFTLDEDEISASTKAALLAALSDKEILATIADATPLDNCVLLHGDTTTTLSFIGETTDGGGDPVPEPTTLLIWGVSLAGLGHRRWRRVQVRA